MREVIDIEALSSDKCSICHIDDVFPVITAVNSIQCNGDCKISKEPLCESAGCKAWFHKTCLKTWHKECVKNTGLGATCPLCRQENTFIWSFGQDHDLKHCIFREDFLQHGLRTAQWNLDELHEMVKGMCLSLAYLNKPEHDELPSWVNGCREVGGLVANAIHGGDLRVIRYLVTNNAYLPGLNSDPDSLLKRINAGNQSLLMVAARTYEDEDAANRDPKIFEYFAAIGCIYDELRGLAVHLVEEDVILFVIKHGFVDLLQIILSTILAHKHDAKVLLHWSLRNKDPGMRTFSALLMWMEASLSPAQLEQALLSCADADLVKTGKLETVFALLPEELRGKFLVRVMQCIIKLQDSNDLQYVLFNTGGMLDHLRLKDCNEIVASLSFVIHSTWKRRFDFEQGVVWTSNSYSLASYVVYMQDHSKIVSGTSRENLMRWDKLTNCDIKFSAGYNGYNFYELIFLRMRVLSLHSPPDLCQKLLVDIHTSFEEAINSGLVTQAKQLKVFMKRVVGAIVGYCPKVLNRDSGNDNIMITFAKDGFVDVFRQVFSQYKPNFGVTNWKGRTCLHVAVYNENAAMVKYLVNDMSKRNRATLKVNQQDAEGRTALMLATCTYSQPWVNWNPKKMNPHKKKVLRIVRTLLTAPAVDVNIQDSKGNTVLLLASISGNEDIVDLVMDLAENVNTNATVAV